MYFHGEALLFAASMGIGSDGVAGAEAKSRQTTSSASGLPNLRGLQDTECPVTHEIEDIKFFFELNDTDEDLGVQLHLGAPEPYKELTIYDPEGIKLATFSTEASFQLHGLDSVFFESAEPTFDEVPRDEILARFPAGTYIFDGKTVDDECIFGTAELTHNIPDGPNITQPIWNDTIPFDEDLVVSWHPSATDIVMIENFQVIVTNDDESDYKLDVRYSNGTRSVVIPNDFLQPETVYEIEVLTREVSGNQAISLIYVTTGSDVTHDSVSVGVARANEDGDGSEGDHSSSEDDSEDD